MYSIETKSLTKKYKDKTVVSNLNLKIKEGELFSLLGTNGAGKTTTIKMLSSLIVPTEGDIIIAYMEYYWYNKYEKYNLEVNYGKRQICWYM